MLRKLGMVLALLAGIMTAAAAPVDGRSRLARKGHGGKIAVCAGRMQFPENAEVVIERRQGDDVKRKIRDGLKKRRPSRRLAAAAGATAAASPEVLASYDISIRAAGRKWQPAAGDPVRVDVELDAPVAVASPSSLGVVHLADDGTVEELPKSRYGFTYNKERTAVTAFWFSAEGFSVYAITETETPKTGSTPARRLYEFYSLDFNKYLDDGVTSNTTYNTYVPRYFKTLEGNYTFRQIVTNNQFLVRPEALPSPLGRTFMGWYLYSTNNANKTVEGVTYDADGYATTPFNFDAPVAFRDGETGEGEYVLRSQFDRVGYVIFHEQPVSGVWPITAVRRGIMTEVSENVMQTSVDISDLKVTYDDTQDEDSTHENTTPRMIFRGWSTKQVMPGASKDVDGNDIVIEKSPFTFTRQKDTDAKPRHLFPVFVNINWLTFKAAATGEGATYIPPRFYYADEGTNSFPVPLRTGYTFNGWWTGPDTNTAKRVSKNDGSLYESADLSGWDGYINGGNLMLKANTTVYGTWTPAPTRYTVVVWQQSATDAANLDVTNRTYDFVASYTNTAYSASTVSVAQTYKNFNYENFHYGRCDDAKVIDGNGSTVLNVYYDRNVRTLKFYPAQPGTVSFRYNNYYYDYSANLGSAVTSSSNINTLEDGAKTKGDYKVSRYGTTGNRTYCIKIGDTWYSLSGYNAEYIYDNNTSIVAVGILVGEVAALAGSSVKDVFPIEGYEGKSWVGDNYYTERLVGFDIMPDTDIIFTLATNVGNGGTIRYYLEVGSADEMGEGGVTKDGKYYKLYRTVVHDYNFLTENEDFYKIDGYWQYKSDCTFGSNGRYPSSGNITAGTENEFYYLRNDQKIEFKDSYTQAILKNVDIKYSDVIAGHVPANPESTRLGYSFTGWYVDSACSTRVFFKNDAEYANYKKGKILAERMPSHNLQFFAGWETEWYLIQIDPNGGQLADGQSLWFWEAYDGEPIEEYSTVTRSFEENVNGTYFYAVQDRARYGYSDEWVGGEATNRLAYYTTNQADPAIRDVSKRYTPVVNAYRYAGWYEVMPDGTEELYGFGQPVKRNTKLKLHWKHLGTYRLHYEPGDGKMVDRDENEETFKLLDSGIYADSSELLVTRTAEPPDGYYFAGWRIRYGDGTVYHPGQSFIFNSAYAVNVPGPDGRPVKQLILDAVYSQMRTVSLTTDANGGTIDGEVATTLPLAYPNAPTLITNITDTARTVSGMRNNAYGHLSNGDGYTCVVKDAEGNDVELTLLGWNTERDGTGTHFDLNQYVGVDTFGNDGANVLYAEWAVPVYFDKNNVDVEWSHDVWGDKYTFVTNGVHTNTYCQITTLNGYATFPEIVRDSSTANKMFVYWSTARYKDWQDCPEFDFQNTPITGPTVLYAIWKDFIEVPFHPVDSSGATPVVREDWFKTTDGITKRVIRVGNETNVTFDDHHADYVTATGCLYAYACLADSVEHISEKSRVSRLYYDQAARATYVEYADGTTGPIPSNKELYFVYFTGDKPLDIGYRVMGQNATFEAKTPVNNGPTSATIGTAATNMASFVVAPNTYVPDHDHYAFAIGEPDATSTAQLRIITPAKEKDNDRPQFLIRNTWRGIEYSLDGGETWGLYGHNAQLYVLYFDSIPTIVNLAERTVGIEDDMTNKFEYVVAISNVITTVTQTQTRTLTTDNRDRYYNYWEGLIRKTHYYEHSYKYSNSRTFWYDEDEWSAWELVSSKKNEAKSPSSSVASVLANGNVETITLLTDIIEPTTWTNGKTNSTGSTSSQLKLTETQTRIITTNAQMVVITQRPVGGFATSNDTGDRAYVYTQTAAATNATYGVTYTNRRESLPVELHVAFAQNAAIDHVDNNWRTETTNDYTLTVPLSVDGEFIDALVKTNSILRAAATDRRFLGAYYGKAVESDIADENKVSLVGPVTSVGFVKNPNADWYRLCLNGDAALALGDYSIYYVYGEIPSIRYMKEGANGALTEIPTLTYVGNPVTMNGHEVSQGETLDVPSDGTPLTVGAGGTAGFYVPLSLDGSAQASLNYYALAAGPADATATNAMNAVTWGTSLRVKVAENGLLKWSLDGETWRDFTGSSASIYAIYKEKGYDLTIAVKSLAADADKAKDVFTVIVESANLVVGNDYVVSGYAPDGTPEDYVKATACDEGGMLTFTVKDGARFTIQSLPNNEWPDPESPMGKTIKNYVLRELLPSSDYALTNLTVNGAAALAQVQVANGTATYMDMNKTLEFTNIKRYTVEFEDENGEEVTSAPYWYGTKAVEIALPGEPPAKAMDAARIYRFTGWTPDLADVTGDAVYKAAYRAIELPHATQRAADTNVVVTLADEQTLLAALKGVGIDLLADNYSKAAADKILNDRDPNGLRRWENLVTGTATNQLLLGTRSGDGAKSLSVGLEAGEGTTADLGYEVAYDLRKLSDGKWTRVAGPVAKREASLQLALVGENGESRQPTGLYRVTTLIVPKCAFAITNEIPSTNVIGVLEVRSAFTNTVVAVPWRHLASDPANARDITVSDHVSALNLTAGDSVYALKDATPETEVSTKSSTPAAKAASSDDSMYEMWTFNGSGWESATTIKTAKSEDGAYSVKSRASAPDEAGFARTKAVWLQRQNPLDDKGDAKPFFLVGQYEADGVEIPVAGGTNADPGYTLISVPDYRDFKINDLDWSGYAPIPDWDFIRIVNGRNSFLLWWRNGKWCVEKSVPGLRGRTFLTFVPYEEPIKAGTGFWFCRHGEAFTIKWTPKAEEM